MPLNELRRLLRPNLVKSLVNQRRYASTLKPVDVGYRVFGSRSDSESPVFLYHGMFASKDVFTQLAGNINQSTGRQVITLDMRNHGESPHVQHEEMSFLLMAEDLKLLMKKLDINRGLMVGHSIGARIMMQMAFNYPQMVEKLIAIDIGFNVPTKQLSFLYQIELFLMKMFETLTPEMSVDEARRSMYEVMNMQVNDASFSKVITDQLVKKDGKFDWTFNFNSMYELLWRGAVHHLFVKQPFNGDSLFIYGNSGFLPKHDFHPVKKVFPKARFEFLEAGHFIFIDKPTETSEIIVKFIKQ